MRSRLRSPPPSSPSSLAAVVGSVGICQDAGPILKDVAASSDHASDEVRTLLESANSPVFGIDADGNINEWNNKAAAITGFSKEEVMGKHLVQKFVTTEFQTQVVDECPRCRPCRPCCSCCLTMPTPMPTPTLTSPSSSTNGPGDPAHHPTAGGRRAAKGAERVTDGALYFPDVLKGWSAV